MLTASMVSDRSVFISYQDFRIFAADPYRGSRSGCAHYYLKIIFCSQCHSLVKPSEVIFAFLRLQLCPCKLCKMSELETELMHMLEITFPLALVPMLRIIVNTCDSQILVIEP